MENKKSYKRIICDFDGVLADSADLTFEGLNYALKKVRLPAVTKEELESKSKLQLVKDRNPNGFQIALILFFARRFFKKHISKVTLFSDFIKELKSFDGELLIVSSNTKANIKTLLGEDIKYFHKVYGGVGFNKKEKILAPYAKDSVYITDEVRDIVECKRAGIDVYSVSWGLDRVEDLRVAGPNGILQNFSEIRFLTQK